MRYLILASAAALIMAGGCATQTTPPTAERKPASHPQCYSGDHGKFFDVGASATLAGINVVCEKTSDGKAAQWMGKKH